MSETIPACKQSNACEKPPVLAGGFLALEVRPSQHLKFFYVAAHLMFFCVLSFAVLPLVSVQILWLLLWLVAVVFIAINLLVLINQWQRGCWRLVLDDEGWWLSQNKGELFLVELNSEILLWQSIIYLQFMCCHSGRKYGLLVLHDSAEHEGLRCLRVWLITKFSR